MWCFKYWRCNDGSKVRTISNGEFNYDFRRFWCRNTTMLLGTTYSKTCVNQPLSKRPKIGFQDQLLLNAGRKYLQNAPRGAFCNTFDLH